MHLLKISDLKKTQLEALIERSLVLKSMRKRGEEHTPLKGKTLGMIFEKPSTRTRVSFEAAMYQLGGNAVFLSHGDSQIGRGEPVRDTSRVMSRYVDGVMMRTFAHSIIDEFAKYSSVPVINGLTDKHHPCQVLADIMTVIEKKGGFEGLKFVWVGDGNNMANSWIEAAAKLSLDLTVACPAGYEPDKEILKKAKAKKDSKIEVTNSFEAAMKDADVINTDVWASMGQETEKEKRAKAFAGFEVNEAAMKLCKEDAVVLHCLPAHRGEEISDGVIEGANSVVWDQAENRLHVQKAVLEWLIGGIEP
ncbi:MAG: ornithine carbamoyltransferase [Deltaproteobacteria bacterium]|nr:ornithine carbamoyltransferase [Deltaproteobacteria bacterium]